MLGAYLSDSGLGAFDYIVAARGGKGNIPWTSHSWLERGNLVVDITADQFSDGPSEIIVSESSEWHGQFSISERLLGDFRKWPPKANDYLPGLYFSLLTILQKT